MTDPVPLVSVVVPVLDESSTLDELLDRIAAVARHREWPTEVLVVDDGSRTEERVRIRASNHPDLHVRHLEHEATFGQADAIASGLVAAAGTVVVTMDGDLQDPPEDMVDLVTAVAAGAEVAKGVRESLEMSAVRRVGARLRTEVASALVGRRLADFGGQFNAYDRRVIPRLVTARLPGRPLIPLACSLGLEVVEVPVRRSPRTDGRSRHRTAALAGMVVDLALDYAPRKARWGAVLVAGSGLVASAHALRSGTGARRVLGAAGVSLTVVVAASTGARQRRRARQARPVATEVVAPPAGTPPR